MAQEEFRKQAYCSILILEIMYIGQNKGTKPEFCAGGVVEFYFTKAQHHKHYVYQPHVLVGIVVAKKECYDVLPVHCGEYFLKKRGEASDILRGFCRQ